MYAFLFGAREFFFPYTLSRPRFLLMHITFHVLLDAVARVFMRVNIMKLGHWLVRWLGVSFYYIVRVCNAYIFFSADNLLR